MYANMDLGTPEARVGDLQRRTLKSKRLIGSIFSLLTLFKSPWSIDPEVH